VAASREDEEAKKMEAGGDTVGQKLDAGALFVLQSKGKLPRSTFLLTPSINIISLLCFTCMASARVLLANPPSATIFVFLEGRQGSRRGHWLLLFSLTQPERGSTPQPELVSSFFSFLETNYQLVKECK